jgi:hypothetical protein
MKTTRFGPVGEVGLHIVLWGTQVLLAFIFALAGLMLFTTPLGDTGTAPWLSPGADRLYFFMGLGYLLASVGLLLPALTRALAFLAPVSALVLLVLTLLAAVQHFVHQPMAVPVDLFFSALAAFVVWGRLVVPLPPLGARDPLNELATAG